MYTRPIRFTTPPPTAEEFTSTTPMPLIPTYVSERKLQKEHSEPSLASLKLDHEDVLDSEELIDDDEEVEDQGRSLTDAIVNEKPLETVLPSDKLEVSETATSEDGDAVDNKDDEEYENAQIVDTEQTEDLAKVSASTDNVSPAVEVHLTQFTDDTEKDASAESNSHFTDDNDGIERQSFLSLTDLIRTLHPNEKQVPQIDSDYSNAMRVLGESPSSLVATGGDDAHNTMDSSMEPIKYQSQYVL